MDIAEIDLGGIPTIYQSFEKRGVQLSDNINDNIADLIFIFGSGLDYWQGLYIEELAEWRARAVNRYKAANGADE